ncbi:MAG: chromosome segregation protein SMC [Zavarzinella sp.]
MLKRLELIGFKSFADRTWFDFPAGLTAIVGPNGSGKSNIVDAVRWILGEQSAKNLRGGEMADVIFNGSATRKPLPMAEVTLTFDNQRKILNTDAAEVSITRRVHRDGTGEYLINHEASRLRDIRELLLGSGAGSAAYCIIEQGRVDALLQASTRDRRAILEEAAGISRFKARKIETLKKLDQTHDNLSRIRDIYSEVEKQLQRVRQDAEKARKFQEYSTRLQELRLTESLLGYHHAVGHLRHASEQLKQVREETGTLQATLQSGETQRQLFQNQIEQTEQQLQHLASELAKIQQWVAGHQEKFHSELQKSEETATEQLSNNARWQEVHQLVRQLHRQAADAQADLQRAEQETQQHRTTVAQLEDSLKSLEGEHQQSTNRLQEAREQQFDVVGRVASLQSAAQSLTGQAEKLSRELLRKQTELRNRTAEHEALGRVVATLNQQDFNLKVQADRAAATLQTHLEQREQLLQQRAGVLESIERYRVEISGLRGRLDLLQSMEESQEGLGVGVRAVLQQLADPDNELHQYLYGLVADQLHVPTEYAGLVDAVLREHALAFVMKSADDLPVLRKLLASNAGRITLIPLRESNAPNVPPEMVSLAAHIRTNTPQVGQLPQQLLGTTILVETIEPAIIYQGDYIANGFRYVTHVGEIVEADGSVTLGTLQVQHGLISRKSELRELKIQMEQLQHQLANAEVENTRFQHALEQLNSPIRSLEEEIRVLRSTVADLSSEIQKQAQQRQHLEEDMQLIQQELALLADEENRIQEHRRVNQEELLAAQQAAEQLRAELTTLEERLQHLDSTRAAQREELTNARVVLAEVSQKHQSYSAQYQKMMVDCERGNQEEHRIARHQETLRERRLTAELTALRASAELAALVLQKETLQAQSGAAHHVKEDARLQLGEIEAKMNSLRNLHQEQLAQMHTLEMVVQENQSTMKQLVQRLEDDYQVDLRLEYERCPLSAGEEWPPTWDGAAATKEMDKLRKQIKALGNVSLEALTELLAVEQRATDLKAQIDDLATAEKSLREIIDRINNDSEKLLAETFHAVRQHFQELFRRLFGGGMADIVLENPNDILESGIEIIARPPGKELRSISLMSGGEKTLTAVALLLAIFQSKPSPFCLLDEVDAALDEANTERLASALKSFTDQSQFIIITHKKRTMAQADVLYGITMQESGISKQVAVRFEDWEDESSAQAA